MPRNLEDVIRSSEVITEFLRRKPKGETEEQMRSAVKKTLSGLEANLAPISMAASLKVANFVLRGTDLKLSGCKEAAFAALKKRGAAAISSHESYADVAVLFKIFTEEGLKNVNYIGGNNLFNVPLIKYLTERWLRTSGLIPVKRRLSDDRDSAALYVATLRGYGGFLLHNGFNLVNFAGTGRSRTGDMGRVSLTATPPILQSAEKIFLVTITYETVPEEKEFTRHEQKKGKGANIFSGFAAALNATGDVYVNFGQPIDPGRYRALGEVEAEARFHTDMTEGLRRLTTITPNNALAYSLVKEPTFLATTSMEREAAERIAGIVKLAEWLGMSVAPKLQTSTSLQEAAGMAVEHFAKIKAFAKKESGKAISVVDQRPVDFYSRQVSKVLNEGYRLS